MANRVWYPVPPNNGMQLAEALDDKRDLPIFNVRFWPKADIQLTISERATCQNAIVDPAHLTGAGYSF